MTERRSDGWAGRPADAGTDRRTAEGPDRSAEVPTEGRLIGVDWGEKRIGLALSDPSQTLAQPLATLSRRAGRRFPIRSFRAHLDAHGPVGVVVGLPLQADGSEGPAARGARDLGELISRQTGLPVAFIDERMTTSRARRAVSELGGKLRGRAPELDRLAATLVLQAFLDRRRQ